MNKSYVMSNRFLIMRRFTQLLILALFIGANYYEINILKGNLSSSQFLSTIPLSDPFAVLQMFFAGAIITTDIIIGAVIILLFYMIIAGRAFCSWVCPVNIVTDLAAWLRTRFYKYDHQRGVLKKSARYWFLGLTFIISALFSVTAFEVISPISILHRGIIFGFGVGWVLLLSIFLFDLLVQKHAWCGHLCPLGGFYNLVGQYNLININYDMKKCLMCNSCLDVCSEKQVLHMIGKKHIPIIDDSCVKCGRCIDVCKGDALQFTILSLAKQKKAKK